MNKRKDFIYELTGRITGKTIRKDKTGATFFRAFAEIDDKPQVKFLTVFKDSLATERIWKDIEDKLLYFMKWLPHSFLFSLKFTNFFCLQVIDSQFTQKY
ncbi:MAG: hypothetical protein GBAus27B_000480 [Mycoplasmataceae bacterium]|nr:MAG: hypothetical protein GBAus27B_000480 [Mycoplasmataceae bacterium]